jgi:hypothetical protein
MTHKQNRNLSKREFIKLAAADAGYQINQDGLGVRCYGSGDYCISNHRAGTLPAYKLGQPARWIIC